MCIRYNLSYGYLLKYSLKHTAQKIRRYQGTLDTDFVNLITTDIERGIEAIDTTTSKVLSIVKSQPRREKRNIFGQIISSLTGLVTEEQLYDFQQIINSDQAQLDEVAAGLFDATSYIQRQHEHLGQLDKTIHTLQQQVVEQNQSLAKHERDSKLYTKMIMLSRRIQQLAEDFQRQWQEIIQEVTSGKLGTSGMPKEALDEAENKFLSIYGTRQRFSQLGMVTKGTLHYLDTLRNTGSSTFLIQENDTYYVYKFLKIPIFTTNYKAQVITIAKDKAQVPHVLLTHPTLSDYAAIPLGALHNAWQDGTTKYLQQRPVHLTTISVNDIQGNTSISEEATWLTRIDDETYIFAPTENTTERITIFCRSDTEKAVEELSKHQILKIPTTCRLESKHFKIRATRGSYTDPSEADLLFNVNMDWAEIHTTEEQLNNMNMTYQMFTVATQPNNEITASDFDSSPNMLTHLFNNLRATSRHLSKIPTHSKPMIIPAYITSLVALLLSILLAAFCVGVIRKAKAVANIGNQDIPMAQHN